MELDLNKIQEQADDVKGWGNITHAWLDTSEDVAAATLGHIDDDGRTYPVAVFDCDQYDAPADSLKLAQFYAAANPAVVRELVRRLRSAESRLHEVATACATAEQERDAWKNAVIDQLDVMHITCARHKDDPVFAVHDCMAYRVNLALDPAISEQAQALVAAGREAARAEREKQEPVFWYRPCCNGELYEGPVHHDSITGKWMRDERPGEWVPLYAGPAPKADHPEHGLELVGLRGCTGCADLGEDQPAEAGGGK